MKHRFFAVVGEVHIIKAYLSLKLRVGDGSVLMRMLPRPMTRVFPGLFDFSVFFCHVDKRDIAVVRLLFFVKQVENSFGTGKRHRRRGKLLGNLIDGHGKAFGQL